MPDLEGVYEVVVTATARTGLDWEQVTNPSWNFRRTLAVRKFQCVVLSNESPQREVGLIDGLLAALHPIFKDSVVPDGILGLNMKQTTAPGSVGAGTLNYSFDLKLDQADVGGVFFVELIFPRDYPFKV